MVNGSNILLYLYFIICLCAYPFCETSAQPITLDTEPIDQSDASALVLMPPPVEIDNDLIDESSEPPPVEFSQPIDQCYESALVSGPKTGVFWDVEDCPFHVELDNDSIYREIESALIAMGYSGYMSIRAYLDDEQMPEWCAYHLLGIFGEGEGEGEGICFFNGGDKQTRLDRMLHDIILWTIGTPVNHRNPANLIVISKQVKDDVEFFCSLRALNSRNYKVFLVQPAADVAPEISECSGWVVNILKRGESIITKSFLQEWARKKVFNSLHRIIAKYNSDEIEDFSKPIALVFGPKTGVFWDVEDCPFPAELDNDSIYREIESALNAMDYCGNMSIWAYVDEKQKSKWCDYLSRKTWETRIYFLHGGDKQARRDRMLHDIILWSIDSPVNENHPGPANLIVVSNQVRDDVEFFGRLRALDSIYYNVFLVEPAAGVASESSKWAVKIFNLGEEVYVD